ncbi:LysR family transcriptional regulator ArgP [Thalassotalea piscium]
MLDYKQLHALSVLIAQQSFEKAANELCITQSAVSQRIKLLEQAIGQPVVIRSQPIRVTRIGQKLLSHYQQVQLLEQDVLPDIHADNKNQLIHVKLACNADSLATWLTNALTHVSDQYELEFNLFLANEDRTINFLQKGEVFGAVSTLNKALPGCTFDKLGDMEYILVASKTFSEKYFANGINKESLQKAPTIVFDPKDDMHIKYLEQEYGLKMGSYPCHTVRSSETFVDFSKQGLAYCLVPILQVQEELLSGELINLLPDYTLTRTLYWHHWILLKGAFKALSNAIIENAHKALANQNKYG